jgi:metallo-beta-lactamase class B
LVVTPAGDIVVNAGYEETPALIVASIEKLGFHAHDVKVLLNGQAHYDHVAGLAALQKLTGAQIYSSAAEVKVLESGGKADFRFGNEYTYPPVKVDRVVNDGDQVTLGGVTLVAHVTGGHSVGCTTWTLQVDDQGKHYDVVIVGGTTINPGVTLLHNAKYPAVSEDFARTFRVLRSLHCDIFLGAHGGYYGMLEKYDRMKRGEQPNPFIDPDGYRGHIDAAEKRYQDQLARERGKK